MMVYRSGWRKTTYLFFHFIQRLVYGDSLLFEDNRRESVIFQVVGLMLFGLVASHELFKKYYYLPSLDPRGCWLEMLLFFTLAMTLSGVLATLHWSHFFIDRLDQLNLGPLPLSRISLFMAKAMALFVGLGSATVAFCLPSALVFQHYVGHRLGCHTWQNGAAYLLTLLMASVLVFLAVGSFLGTLFLLCSGRFLRYVKASAPFLLFSGFISVLAWFPRVVPFLSDWRVHENMFLRLWPPYWFLCLWGRWNHLPEPSDVHRLVLPSLLMALGVYLLCLGAQAVCRGRFVESFTVGGSSVRGHQLWAFLSSVFMRNAFERGVAFFFIRTLRRSQKQKVQFLLVFAFPVAFAVTEWVGLAMAPTDHRGAIAALADVPLYLHTFLLLGIRQALRIPGGNQAHFLFQLIAPADVGRVQRSLDRAIVLTTQVPLAMALTILMAPWWGLASALRYNLYALVLATVLRKILFYSFLRFPFCSNDVPDRFRMKQYWPIYLVVFIVGMDVFLRVGRCLVDSNWASFGIVGLLLLTGHLLHMARERSRRDQPLVFDEEPEPVMLSLDLE